MFNIEVTVTKAKTKIGDRRRESRNKMHPYGQRFTAHPVRIEDLTLVIDLIFKRNGMETRCVGSDSLIPTLVN